MLNIKPTTCEVLPAFSPVIGEVGRARSHGRKAPSPQATCISVLAAFNTWAFKREQPDCLDRLTASVEACVAKGAPLRFVLYWGKGPRFAAGEAERKCLDFLRSMAARIKTSYPPGAEFTLIFTDTHAALNGYEASETTDYFDSVLELLPPFGIKTCCLGALITSAARDLVGFVPPSPAPTTLLQLEKTAAKWYRGPGCPADGARRYFDANMVERRAVELAFPGAIFLSFNGRESRALFPDALPVFYMYSLKKGVSVKPWFVP